MPCASDARRSRARRWWLLAAALLTHVGCQQDCSGLPNFNFPDCKYGEVTWQLGSATFTKVEDLVDPSATPLVGKIRVGQIVSLGPVMPVDVCTQDHAPSVAWTSTAPAVATVQARGTLFADLTGISEGESEVFATVEGTRTPLRFRCCAPCVSPPPLPSCSDVAVAAVRVVP